jgi:hypothetical protein
VPVIASRKKSPLVENPDLSGGGDFSKGWVIPLTIKFKSIKKKVTYHRFRVQGSLNGEPLNPKPMNA